MTTTSLFRIDRNAVNPIAGLKFGVGILIAAAASAVFDLELLVVFIGSFLAWLTDLPGPTRNRLLGMAAFGFVGVGLVWLAAEVADDVAAFPITLAVVAFVLTIPMVISQRAYQVGWSAILLFFSIAAFTGPDNEVQAELAVDLLIGVAIVIAITAAGPTAVGPYGNSGPDTPEAGGEDDIGFALVYSVTIATVLGLALYIGMESFTAGAVWAANGAFFIIGPNTQQSLTHAVERAVGVLVGVAIGVLAVELISGDAWLVLIWTALGILAVATLTAGYFIMVAAYTAGMTMTWAVQGEDTTTLNATDRILAEAAAFVLAIAAVVFLQWWTTKRSRRPSPIA